MRGEDLGVDFDDLRDSAAAFANRGQDGHSVARQLAGALNFGGSLPCGYDETGKNYLEGVMPIAQLAHQTLLALGDSSVMLGDLVKAFADRYEQAHDNTVQITHDTDATVGNGLPGGSG